MLTKGVKIRIGASASILVLSALLVSLLSFSLASAHGTSQPRTWQAEIAVESQNRAIQGMAFLPGVLWINVGDTVVWTVKAGDIHTVTFLKPGQTLPSFNPADPLQALPQGGSVYDGVSYFNSGIMSNFPFPPPGVPGGTTYKLTFGVAGDFTYHCLVHPSMIAIVHVRPAGTPYPFTQQDYNDQINSANQIILNDGRKLADIARDHSSSLNVTLGTGDAMVSVVRFFPQVIVIHVGDTVKFTNRDPMEPHTVSFGTFPPGFNNFNPLGDPTKFDGSAPLNSGFIVVGSPFGTTYQVKFVKVGTFAFRCDLHDFLGMLLTVIVKP
jgi:plastocyanin